MSGQSRAGEGGQTGTHRVATAPGSAFALGLVSTSTSDTRFAAPGNFAAVAKKAGAEAFHLVDRKASRLRRMKHGVLTNARLISESCPQGFRYRPVMVTLTYAPGEPWRARQVSHFLKCAREWHKRRGQRMRCVWVAEMQERGAVHYHAIFWLARHLQMPKPDKRGWWVHGLSKIEAARNAVGYIAKYASKGETGPAFPLGVRIHGACGLDSENRRVARWWRAPSESREFLGQEADIRFVKGGRVDARTGAFWRSCWRYVSLNGVHHIIKLEGVTQ